MSINSIFFLLFVLFCSSFSKAELQNSKSAQVNPDVKAKPEINAKPAIKADDVVNVKANVDADVDTEVETKKPKELTSIDFRKIKKNQINLIYSLYDLIIPSKTGLSYNRYFEDSDSSYEFEWVKGSYSVPLFIADLGKVSEHRVSIQKRSYNQRNSFHFIYGLAYHSFSMTLGPDLIGDLVGASQLELVEIKTLGVNYGIANRWYFNERFSLTVDWIAVSQPLAILKKEAPYLAQSTKPEDRDKVQRVVDVATFWPRLSAFKVSLGWSF